MRAVATIPVLFVFVALPPGPSAQGQPKERASGKITLKATDSKLAAKFDVQKDEWLEFDVQGKWRMGDKLPYTGFYGHIKLNRINKLGYLGTLVVQIGKSEPFALWDEFPFQAPASGPVYIWANRQGFTTWKTDGTLDIIIRAGDHLKDKRTTQPDPEIKRALAMINEARKTAGVEEVQLSAALSAGCQKHARYLVVNAGNPRAQGLKVHDEFKDLKEYSEEGAKSAKVSVIHSMPMSVACEEWLASFYHRVPLFHPSLKEIGAGYFQQAGEWACAIDCLSGADGKSPKEMVFYPEDQQGNVPLNFGLELPSPLPAGHKGDAGYPITVSFYQGQKVTNVTLKLTGAKDADVPVYLSTPEAPATSFPQKNTVCAIPKQPLAKGTTYKVELSCMLSGKPYSRTWRFTTEK